MNKAVVRQFLDFFQEFLNLCKLENWPENDTTEAEIKNAFLIAQHIEKCLDRLQRRNLINEFLSTLNSTQDLSSLFLKNCFADPPKYILRKIINCNNKISQMDVGFKVFLQLFSEEKLETYLTDLMLEAASKETLLRNMSKELPKEKVLEFKSELLLSELNSCEDPKASILDLLQNSTKDTIELLVVSLLNKDIKYGESKHLIVNAFIQFMSSKNHTYKQFWKLLFHVEEKYLVQLCLEHAELFKMMTGALLDSGMLLRERMSAEYFYIDLTYSELVFIAHKICANDNLKLELLDIVRESNADLEFWENIVS